MPSKRNAREWYAEWLGARPLLELTPKGVNDAKAYFRFTPIGAYPKGVEVLKGEVGFLPCQGVRLIRQARVS